MNDYISVSELNQYIGGLLEEDVFLQNFWLKGEISGFKLYQQSGHLYFTLKDRDSAVSCVMFRSRARQLSFKPEDGMEVLLRGAAAVFARQGKYQVYAEEMQPYGTGGLFLYLEKLKKQFEARGYFAAEIKKPIPRMVNRLGLVTSQDGAAWRDILKVVRERHSRVEIVLVHSAVQGIDAPAELARGVRMLNRYNQVDLIIIGRGGGSFEDLMAFNSEEVVQAIYESNIPVISAVGHEVDFCLADLVADLRAATPTQAAQLAVPDLAALEAGVETCRQRMIRTMERCLVSQNEILDRIMMKKVWRQPGLMLENQRQQAEELALELERNMKECLSRQQGRLALAATALDKLSPLKILQRGYALVLKNGSILRDESAAVIGDELEIMMHQARLQVQLKNKERVEKWKD